MNLRRSIFFFNDTATTEIYTLSLHDALPIFEPTRDWFPISMISTFAAFADLSHGPESQWGSVRDRKSTRLNSSHQIISYAVFCLKKKKYTKPTPTLTHNDQTPPAPRCATTAT